ncbi:hypothetical protein DL93DRAFT_2165785 [Clavulina sp. PMI_390]|nr:hypothetical protein DL93DRAFT_2165785 [Clavulina sp. PMI_390]
MNYLGAGLDLTTISTNDINGVIGGLKSRTPIINIDETIYRNITVANVLYNVPRNCFITGDTATQSAVTTYYADGSAAASALTADASLAGKYLAVSASAETTYSITKTFHTDTQYSLFDFQSLVYVAGLKDWILDIDEGAFISPIRRMGPWNPSNSTVVEAYRNFFNSYGSHVITSVQFGARYSMTVWGGTSDSTVDENWQADVAVAYDGVTSSGKFDANITGSSEYSTFMKEKSQTISVQGGDIHLADALATGYGNDTNYENFSKWVETTNQAAGLISMNVDSIWSVFSSAQSDILYYAAQELENAFQWIVQNPAPHWTYVSLSLSTDWTRFRVLNPGSYIVEDPKNPWYDVQGASLTRTQVQIGLEHSHDYTNSPVVYFYIVNDGSPLDFTLSHGSGREASATAIVNNKPFTNSKITDNYWNEIAYWSVEANPNVHVDYLTGVAVAKLHDYPGYGLGTYSHPWKQTRNLRGWAQRESSTQPQKRSNALRPSLFDREL